MCGIIGVVRSLDVSQDLIKGLERLEYRGYDSAGITTISGGSFQICKAVGKISALKSALHEMGDSYVDGNIGIGHTRWATHGAPSIKNTHPIITKEVALVHNGIIENYQELKNELISRGVNFESDTDSEVIAALISEYISNGMSFVDACLKTVSKLIGSYAVAVISKSNPDVLVGFKNKLPLLIGIGEDQAVYIASDSVVVSDFVKKVIYLENQQIVKMTTGGVCEITDFAGNIVKNIEHHIQPDISCVLSEYTTFMMKEIYEQPEVLRKVLESYKTCEINWNDFSDICIIACGSSFYAGCVAKYWIQSATGKKVEVEIASEFALSGARLFKNTLYLFVSQSGETADVMSALDYVKRQSLKTACVTNVSNSTFGRSVDYLIEMNAGREISVAATKTFTAQLMTMLLLCLEIQGYEKKVDINSIVTLDIRTIESQVAAIAEDISKYERFLYLGRNVMYPLALEGALKLRELTYVSALGIAAGELKHGSIALVDDKTLSIVLAPYGALYSKMSSCVQEIRARGGDVLLITNLAGAEGLCALCQYTIILPDTDDFLNTIIYSLPLQFIAYHIAMIKGCDIDKPRNLAKSVTVE